MSATSDVHDRDPSTFAAALARFDTEVGQREPRRVSLHEIVTVVRADRSTANA